MTAGPNAHLKAYVASVTQTGDLLEAERRTLVRQADSAASLRCLNALFDSVVHLHRPSATSGLGPFLRDSLDEPLLALEWLEPRIEGAPRAALPGDPQADPC